MPLTLKTLSRTPDMLTTPDEIKVELQHLMKHDDGVTVLNSLRSDQKDFQYTSVKLEIGKVNQIESLYQFTKTFLPSLDLSNNAVRYYADITERYAPFRLRKLSTPTQWLHVLCFVYHLYQLYISCT